ncbi:efflux RND transporter permease subunit [Desulfovibrio ferrophilus]|uniref:Acriflavin resistance protein n=1 Tax=Desulfovibrio ferrophilus TaxID=241368 RepID=A0A2Z6B1W1_9BACT|nr:efflux RND transporter permease subunit [Desulfovibrio ferrophilus]BBD09509.1 acriflavin resistance protein [Desulfovibrio ferrophilus]
MNLPQFCVRRPVLTAMATLIVVTVGIFSLSRLRVDLLPAIELPTVSVRVNYEGASPEVMERLVTQVIEEVVATVPGVEEITSTSSTGRSDIRVRFSWGVSIDTAALDVRARLEDELNELPDDVERPWIRKFDVESFPVVILGIKSDLDPVELTELIEVQLRYRFARIPGVAQVDVWGGFNREVRVELDPDRIKALGLPLDDVLEAIEDANLDLPAGTLEHGLQESTLRAPAEFISLDQIRDTVIAKREDGDITLGQVAAVKDTHEKLTRIIRVNQGRGVRVGIRKQADANTLEVASGIMAEIKAINHDYPQVQVVPVINQGNFIERSITNVAHSVAYGGILAVLVLFFFLRSIQSTIIISLAIPISIVATFALIFFGGFTLNLMTLGGLALGVGMIVDNSIVVLENIFRRMKEESLPVSQAAVEGAREVGPAIVASTLTTLVIFLPLAFLQGVSGVLFKEMAYVIIFSLLCSLVLSLSLLPTAASRLLKPQVHAPGRGKGGLGAAVEAFGEVLTRLDAAYRDLVKWALGHRKTVVFGACLLLMASLLLLPLIGREFMPPSDEGEVRITGEMEVGTRLGVVDAQTRFMESLIYPAVPEAVSSVVSVQSSASRKARSEGEIRLSLLPAAKRHRSNTEIAKDLRRLLEGNVPGMRVRVRAPQGQFLLDRLLGGDEGLTVEIRGFELGALDALAGQVAQDIAGVLGISDTKTSQEAGLPQQELRIDRDKAADLGLSVRDVSELLETAVAGSKAGEYRHEGNSYRIFVKLADAEQRSMDEILDLTLTSASGEQVALRNVVSATASRGPVLITRKDQQRQVTVQANVAGRDLGSVARDVQAIIDRIPRPVGYELRIAGNYEEQQKASRELAFSMLLALGLVYMVLACQYESLRDPLVVMLSVPFAAIGVILTLFLTGTTLNVQSYIGCVMLEGIVVNNAILLVDQAGRLFSSGMGLEDSLTEAARRRLRPIMMTTLTTILGLLPLALGIGEGAEAQAPLARAVIGGLTASTLITLVLIPVVYAIFHAKEAGNRH